MNVGLDSIDYKFRKLARDRQLIFLYFSRIERSKGIFELIDAFKDFSPSSFGGCCINLLICGDGFALNSIKQIVADLKLNNIHIEGFIDGENKRHIFAKCHVFILPSHTEGMPLSVLEAMGFGLPVIATPVGGLNDFFIDGEHGFTIKINSPDDIKEKLFYCANNIDVLGNIAINNFLFAHQRFRSDIVCRRLEHIHQSVLGKQAF